MSPWAMKTSARWRAASALARGDSGVSGESAGSLAAMGTSGEGKDLLARPSGEGAGSRFVGEEAAERSDRAAGSLGFLRLLSFAGPGRRERESDASAPNQLYTRPFRIVQTTQWTMSLLASSSLDQ